MAGPVHPQGNGHGRVCLQVVEGKTVDGPRLFACFCSIDYNQFVRILSYQRDYVGISPAIDDCHVITLNNTGQTLYGMYADSVILH